MPSALTSLRATTLPRGAGNDGESALISPLREASGSNGSWDLARTVATAGVVLLE